MSGQYQYRGPDHLRVLAAHDPLGAQLYIRSLRSACIRAMASALARFAGRRIKQRFEVSQCHKPVEPPFYTSLPGSQPTGTGAK